MSLRVERDWRSRWIKRSATFDVKKIKTKKKESGPLDDDDDELSQKLLERPWTRRTRSAERLMCVCARTFFPFWPEKTDSKTILLVKKVTEYIYIAYKWVTTGAWLHSVPRTAEKLAAE
ncbi:hypothetical protein WH47_08256 [Habropoda laboriosa]|uniref:Uncharacterized protein n=1 Tax=Habropoda laboriosa TaxID=597456 RepID=A0A0L7RGK2_9HYME|nr:hypothetical protein WH47_08256 [Habropoda laboriosa]